MKRFISVLLLAVSALTVFSALCSCGESAPEKAVVGYFEALQDLDAEKLIGYSADGNTGTVDFSALKGKETLAKKLLHVTLTFRSDGIDRESAKEAEETAVTAEISCIDSAELFGRLNGEISLSGGERAKLLADALDKGDFRTKKTEIKISLVKQNGEWKIPLNQQKNSQLLSALNVTYIIKWITE